MPGYSEGQLDPEKVFKFKTILWVESLIQEGRNEIIT